MLYPFPLGGFRRGFDEVESIIPLVIAITLDPGEGNFHRAIACEEGCNCIEGVGGSTSAVDLIGHGGHTINRLGLLVCRGATPHNNGYGYRDAILPNAK